MQCLGPKVGFLEIHCHVKIWVRERDSGVNVVHQKVNILAKVFQSLRYVLDLEVRVDIQKVVYTLNFILWERCLFGCLISLGNPL